MGSRFSFPLLFFYLSTVIIGGGCKKQYYLEESSRNVSFPIYLGFDVFNADGSHVQGIAANKDALFLSQDCHLAKVDWTGKVLETKSVINHTGDLCWYNDELYSAVALNFSSYNQSYEDEDGMGLIQVYDEGLRLVREKEVDRRIDGICCVDGVLYVGMGAKEQPSKAAHRINIIGRFDASTLEEIAPRIDIDYGYQTNFGVQNLTTDGVFIYGSFYSDNGAPQIVQFDRDLNVCATFYLRAYQGLEVLPQKRMLADTLFIWAETISNEAGIACRINTWRISR